MAIRIQLRRDTAANWVTNNPTLREGELGIETDTLKIKIGNGSAWNSISNYANVVPSDLDTTLGDYVTVNDIGAQGGVVGLNSSYNAIIPGSSIVIEGATDNAYETTLTVTDPTADRTITLPDAAGTVALTSNIPSTTDSLSEGSTNLYFTDDRAQDAVAQALANGTHTNISVSYNDGSNAISLTGAVTYTDENAQDAVGNAVGTGLTYTDSTGEIKVTPNTYDAYGSASAVAGDLSTHLSDTTAHGTTGDVVGTSDTQTLTNKTLTSPKINENVAVTSTATELNILDGATLSTTELNYVDGVTSAIQTQLDAKAPLASPTFTGTVILPSSASYVGSESSGNAVATNSYVDNAVSGLDWKSAVNLKVTSNVNLADAAGTYDGHAVGETQAGYRFLLTGQSTGSENGIYVASWVDSKVVLTRPADADTYTELVGASVYIMEGTQYASTSWVQRNHYLTSFSSQNWTQFSGSGTVTAGTGITVDGLEVSVNRTSTDTWYEAAGSITTAINALTTDDVEQGSTNKYFSDELAQDAVGNAVGTGLTYTDSTGAISVTANTYDAYGAASTVAGDLSAHASDTTTHGTTGDIVGTSDTQTLTNKTLTSPKINEDVAVTSTATEINILDGATLSTTELNYVDGVTSSIQTQLDAKVDESLFDTKGDILVASADNTPAKLAVGTNGYLLTANSSATNGVEWAAAPVSLPTQTDQNGKYLTTDGSTASWATLVVPIETGTATVSLNTATTVDTTALSAFTSIEYMVSLKQGSKVRTSKVVVQTDGTSVDMTEFAITETGGTIAGVVVSAAVSSTNAVLQVTATDASSTNVAVKFSKVKL